MTDRPRPVNRSAQAPDMPRYAQPVLGNPAATLMESGVGNCFPGLEFDLRQLDVRFFPGLTFAFPGVTPAGPDGTQGAVLVNFDTSQDPIFGLPHRWLHDLKTDLNGPKGSALGSGTWYLHAVEQYGRRIELYDFTAWQNAVSATPYEGEIAWWIIRLIELDPDPEVADLTIALTQRDAQGQPTGQPVILRGKRRAYLDGEGMIPDVYRPGELTSSMCSPWTHDFRDCACQYWASNHPDVALGPVADPNAAMGAAANDGATLADHTSATDAAQAVTFLDWMRRRHSPSRDVSAQPTIELARPGRYDPYEINLHWEQLSFVLQGQEVTESWAPTPARVHEPYEGLEHMLEDLANTLARLEFTLSMEYLYAYFSLRAPDEVTPQEEAAWPGLTNDLRAARQLILSVAISEMTHLRWVNQTLWILCAATPGRQGSYRPVIAFADSVDDLDAKTGAHTRRAPELKPATPDTIQRFVDIERPGGDLDTEYAALVEHLREAGPDRFPPDLYQLAVRIDSDGLSHFQKFRDVLRILSPYAARPEVCLRPVRQAAPDDARVQGALALLDMIVENLRSAYAGEAASIDTQEGARGAANAGLDGARDGIETARTAMHDFSEEAERLARLGIGVPFFAHAAQYDADAWNPSRDG